MLTLASRDGSPHSLRWHCQPNIVLQMCSASNKKHLPWRNWLARPTVNREVRGSSPRGRDSFCIFDVLGG